MPRNRHVIFPRVEIVGKALIMISLITTALGWLMVTGLGRNWLGRLLGDLHFSKVGFIFHLPIMTCLALSVLLSLLMWFYRR